VILAIETSCDETCAAVVERAEVRSNIVSSQAALHGRFGGVVPEIASRRHLELVGPVVREALADAGASFADLRAIAVTAGPGLIGALLVGVSAAKAYAYAAQKPLIPVDHLHGHVASLFIAPEPLEPPFLCLLASGGHTLLLDVHDHVRWTVLGRSLDDAAGEAFDKGARLLGLGYPGGPAIERAAVGGDPEAVALPVAMAGREGLDLSFSGLKTALRTRLRDEQHDLPDVAASYQAAIVASLVSRTLRALDLSGARRLGVVGGVAANSLLRATLEQECARRDVELRCAPLVYCGDNAAMIGAAAEHLRPVAFPQYLEIDAHARANLMAQSV
jgi:N6-L-threonylcarbamoyladenine synthase